MEYYIMSNKHKNTVELANPLTKEFLQSLEDTTGNKHISKLMKLFVKLSQRDDRRSLRVDIEIMSHFFDNPDMAHVLTDGPFGVWLTRAVYNNKVVIARMTDNASIQDLLTGIRYDHAYE